MKGWGPQVLKVGLVLFYSNSFAPAPKGPNFMHESMKSSTQLGGCSRWITRKRMRFT